MADGSFPYSTIPGLTPAASVSSGDLLWLNQNGADVSAKLSQLAAILTAQSGGPAGGDLGGSYPNPLVAKVTNASSVAIGAALVAGDLLSAYSASATAQVEVIGDGRGSALVATRYSTDFSEADIIARHARGTMAAPLSSVTGDYPGMFISQAWDGFNWRTASNIMTHISSFNGPNDFGTELLFNVRSDGVNALGQVLKIDKNGKFYVSNFGGFPTLDQLGNLTSATLAVGPPLVAGSQLSVYSNSANAQAAIVGDGQYSSIQVKSYGGGLNASAYLLHANGTAAAPTPPSNGAFIGNFGFTIYDGSGTPMVAGMEGFVDTFTGVANNSSYLTFLTRPDGAGAPLTERMRIDKNGNVGIGTSPVQIPGAVAVDRLSVYSTTGASRISAIGDAGANAAVNSYVYGAGTMNHGFAAAGGTLAAPTAVPNGRIIGNLNWSGWDGAGFGQVAAIGGIIDTYTAAGNVSGYLTFQTRADGAGALLLERMRIDKNGTVTIGTGPLYINYQNIGVLASIVLTSTAGAGAAIQFIGNGATTPQKYIRVTNGQFQIVNSGYSAVPLIMDDAGNLTLTGLITSAGPGFAVNYGTGVTRAISGQTNGTQRWAVVLADASAENPGTNVGSQYVIYRYADNGSFLDAPMVGARNTGVFTFTQPLVFGSDGRNKRDVRPVKKALGLIERLKGVSYTQGDVKQRQFGFVAQDMAKVLPDIVFEGVDDDKTLGIAYTNLIAIMAEAIKELSAQVRTLEAAIQR